MLCGFSDIKNTFREILIFKDSIVCLFVNNVYLTKKDNSSGGRPPIFFLLKDNSSDGKPLILFLLSRKK